MTYYSYSQSPMSIWRRLLAATRAAVTTFNKSATVPLKPTDWDTFEHRRFRYYHGRHYFYNTIYSKLAEYASQHIQDAALYQYIRSIYNPVARLVDTYVSNTWGGRLDIMGGGQGGAIPLNAKNPRIIPAIQTLWQWSNFQMLKSELVRTCAMNGDVFVKLVDNRQQNRIRFQILDPLYVPDVEFDESGNILRVNICYTERDPMTGQLYVYEEYIDPTIMVTFRDGMEYAFYTDASGNPVSRWPNTYGFVPLMHFPFKQVGPRFGATPFFNITGKIDELNSEASSLNDQISKATRPVWFMPGVSKANQVKISTGQKDVSLVYGPAGAQAIPMVFNLDLMGAAQNIEAMLQEIERDTPELALHRVREGSTPPSGKAMQLLFGDASARIEETRVILDTQLTRTHKMGMVMASMNGLPGFESLGIDALNNGDLDHEIADRPIFPDSLTTKETIDTFISTGAPERWTWELLGVPDQEIEKGLAYKQEKSAQTIGAFGSSIFGGENGAT